MGHEGFGIAIRAAGANLRRMTTAQIVANMAATPERDFWLTATKPCGRSFRLRIKRHWLFAVTLQYWPFKVNEPPISAAEACRAFDDLKPEFWAKLPRGAQVKIYRWLHHFAERHTGVMIACTGTLDLNPEWTAAIQRNTAREELSRLLPELKAILMRLDAHDGSPMIATGLEWCNTVKDHLARMHPRLLLKPAPAYTPEQIAEGGRIIADMRNGGWLHQ